jgi:hypothetical protein
MDDEESAWIHGSRNGDHNAFASLIKTHQRMIHALTFRMTGSLADDFSPDTAIAFRVRSVVCTLITLITACGALAVALSSGAQNVQATGSPDEGEIFFADSPAAMSRGAPPGFTNGFMLSFGRPARGVLPSNSLTNLLNELCCPAFKLLVTEERREGNCVKRVPEFRVLVCLEPEYGEWISLAADTERDSVEYQRFRRRAEFYILSRYEGHTTNYVYAAIQETEATNYSLPSGFPRTLKERYWIPSGWIQGLEIPPPSQNSNATNMLLSPNFWLVVDGEFAWVYDSFGFRQRRDAKEYDPKLKRQFEVAREEACAILKKEGYDERFLPKALLDSEMQRILKEKHQINWFTPEELLLLH